MALPTDVASAVAGSDLGWAFLFKFDFASSTERLHTGFGKIRTLDSQEWDGLGDIVSVDGLQAAMSGSAPGGRIGVSGVSPSIVPVALGEESEYAGRPVTVFFQVFQNRAPVGNPCPLLLRIMTTIAISRTGNTRSIAINHESPYAGRNNPANGWYTDRDQQARWPGDRFCERTPFLIFKNERWPDY